MLICDLLFWIYYSVKRGKKAFSRWCHWLFCFQSISDKKNITWAQVKEIRTWEKTVITMWWSVYCKCFSLYYNFVVKEYLKCFINTIWMFYVSFSTSHRAILGHGYSTYKISNLLFFFAEPCGLRDLSSATRDWTWAHGSESAES